MLLFVLAALLAMSQTSTPLEIRTVVKGSMSGIESPQQVIVRSTAEWSALWKRHDPNGPIPSIDFSREMVLGVFLGRRPTAGFAIEIVKAVGNSGTLIVEYAETAPPRDLVTAQVLTAPYHLAAISKYDGEVRFQRVVK